MDTSAAPTDRSGAAASPPAVAGWDALAADGSVVHLRPVRPEDEEALRQLHERASDRSIYLRYFTLNRDLGTRQSRHMAEAAPADRSSPQAARRLMISMLNPLRADAARGGSYAQRGGRARAGQPAAKRSAARIRPSRIPGSL